MDISIASFIRPPDSDLMSDTPAFDLAAPPEVNPTNSGPASPISTSLVAQIAIPGTEPNRSFATLQEAEGDLRRRLVERVDAPDSDGDVAFIFSSGDRFYLYGPDSLERFGDDQTPLGLNRLGPAYANRLSAAQAALGDDAAFMSGGIIINGHFHKLNRSADGYLLLGQPTRTF